MRRSWLRLFWLSVVLVGALAGYLASSSLGERLLDREIETQLSRLLQGKVEIEEVDLRWEGGFLVEARDFSAYPRTPPESDGSTQTPSPALRARRVLAWVDVVALLIGRLELSTLVLEGPQLRVVQHRDGHFEGLPIPPVAAYPDPGLDDRSDAEKLFAALASLDLAASGFADRFRAADRVEILDGTLSWVGPSDTSDEDPDQSDLRIELLNATFERNWLSDTIALEADGVFLDGEHAPFPFAAQVNRPEGDAPHFAWSIELSRIPLAAAETPLAFVEPIEGLAGTLDARIGLVTEEGGVHRVSISGRIDDARITLRSSRQTLSQDRVDLDVALVIDPLHVSVASARLAGGDIALELKGAIERPIRRASPTRIETRLSGLGLDDITGYARSAESESKLAFGLARLTERVRSGEIDYVEAAGSARLRRWQDFLTGHNPEPPTGFTLRSAFSDLTVESGPEDVVEALQGEIEWTGDRIIFRNGTGLFRGTRLPQMDAVLNGVSHLVRTSASARTITRKTPDLPGLGPLGQIIKPRNPELLPPVKAVGLAIDYLEHPILRWPLRELRVLVEPLRRGIEVSVREGTWGGAAVSGEVVWFNDPSTPSVSATLNLSPAPASAPSAEAATAATAAPDRWGAGRFEMEFRARRWLPFEKGTGHFRLEGTDLIGDELEIALEHQGAIAARLTLGLEDPASVGFDTTFALTEGRMAQVGPFVALPAELATGEIGATGGLAGRLRPGRPFIAELDGRVRAEAREGRVYTNLPLMFRLAKATEGYNPFADKNELQYETMNGSFDFAQGLISVQNFEIEGPLRVYARADIDTNPRPVTIRAVVGIFLFRKPNQLLESLPVLKYFLPGSERGLIGTYFRVDGPIAEPEVDPLPLQSLMSGVPSAIKAPFKALRFLFDQMAGNDS